MKLEEAMSLQQQQHSDSTKRSNDILRSMEEKLGVTEKKLKCKNRKNGNPETKHHRVNERWSPHVSGN